MNKTSDNQKLLAISLLDGRNRDKMDKVSEYFSEYALIKYRIKIEILYLIFLSSNTKLIRKITSSEEIILKKLINNFKVADALKIKEIEKKINHDVKAVEYFLKEKLSQTTLTDLSEFIHFGLTSYDINIPSYALMISDYRNDVLVLEIHQLLNNLKKLAIKTKSMDMLGRTHGQPALPTTMGKELSVYYQRLKAELEVLKHIPIEAKLTGAVGNFNALEFVSPETNWIAFSRKFIESLGLVPNIITTQILPYDSWLRLFDSFKRLNNILLGFTQDIWWYISMEYFIQVKLENEVGSSTMSHKINPITFENAEGNLGLANSLFEFFVKKLAVSRLQRDLSDSTIKRDFGLAFGFSLLAWDSILSGLSRISPNAQKMKEDLDSHWEIFSEGIQTYLKLHGYKNAFELLKIKTRGQVLTRQKLYEIIDELPIKEKDKKNLKINDLGQYSGLAEELVELSLIK